MKFKKHLGAQIGFFLLQVENKVVHLVLSLDFIFMDSYNDWYIT